ncbi:MULTISPECIES: aldo/keto reductase [unclassified Leeuwenhoekiella]|uniref:aldo/keto reductase n=1 Tax=unclassified Leeuwenhoekiella TaxID=2615029 RepID=UPI000C3AF9B9|nr:MULTISPECIES: aldo/keto reductase [unclassified Leeuwenhoekiella]MAW96107.1 aldo/keto reductase [Leeuwenhoekiella sp.]MBA80101.1 aldo/keto reductase [Leeuwenhoekiella sp.]|tara:strand:+ start:14959 stop:15993 length:1035 start_codon:yes stop_codon:yes gene_type:complete
MRYTTLPGTDVKISKICLGTMTWGEQNTEAEGHAQLDYAVEQGINFIDTAELYSVPAKAETYGSTESIIGTWLNKRGKRDDLIIASKIAGPAEMSKHIRTGGYTKAEFKDAIHKSLKRLQTDYIDLYQLHWPERNTNYFGKLGYTHDADERWEDNFAQILEDLNAFIQEGLIRHIGVSNETPYGLGRYLEEARNGKPKMISVQNPYNLLNRKDEIGMTEIMLREDVGYLAYSPLGFGTLSGKYIKGTDTETSRINRFPQYSRYSNDLAVQATQKYQEIADKHGLSLTQMALAFVTDRPFMMSNIIGATSMQQLEENIGSINVRLSEELLEEINAVHTAIPNPAP